MNPPEEQAPSKAAESVPQLENLEKKVSTRKVSFRNHAHLEYDD